jgi:hypothetical protein
MALAAALSLTAGTACASDMARSPGDKTHTPEASIESVLRTHKPRLLALDGVIGVGRGLCQGRPCIKVMVRERTPGLARRIGAAIEGYEVEIIETGPIRALDGK